MSFSVGIIGLPNAGKSTLFKALTKNPVDIADYPFTTIKPNIGIVAIPDERLEKIAQAIKPEKITPTIIEFIDIAGLVKDAHKGEGLGNQFLAQIRNCDALVEVIKAFGAQPTPESDIEIIRTELELKDLAHSCHKEGEEKENLLSKKPVIYIINTDNKILSLPILKDIKYLEINLKEESEISELSENEILELGIQSKLDQLILNCYNLLDLITFFTITSGKEARAWTIEKGSKCPIAGGKVHSDFEEKFIRAEVINWQKLVAASKEAPAPTQRRGESLAPKGRKAGSWKQARELGQILTAGKEYIVQNGDVIEFKI